MFHVKYYKDYSHNYLVISCNEECKENGYRRKMITSNSMKGLLRCQERHVNGDMLLYYEITSRQSLADIYSEKVIGWNTLHGFFRQLKMVSDLLQKYLLDENGLILMPEYIFCNMETEEFSFLFYPEANENSFMELVSFLTERVDEEDLQAVEIIYKIADLIHREQFVLDEVLEWFQESEDRQRICEASGRQESEDRQRVCEVSGRWQEKQASTVSGCMPSGIEQKMGTYEGETQDEEGQEGETLPGNYKKMAVFFAAVGISVAGVLLYIMNNYRINSEGKIWLAAGFGLSLILLVSAAFLYGYRTYEITKCRWTKHAAMYKTEKNKEQSVHGYVQPFAYDVPKQQADDYGNTVFIPWIDSCENRLYGMGKGNKYHIDLNSLPITVGKMAGAVDMILNDQSISRMHAKFSRAGSKICITDLNSTNGTFKNGLRLMPNDSEIIEPGDEIRIGKLKFIYR